MQTENKPGGRIVLTIEEYRLMRGISKNKIVLGADVQRTQLQNTVRTGWRASTSGCWRVCATICNVT